MSLAEKSYVLWFGCGLGVESEVVVVVCRFWLMEKRREKEVPPDMRGAGFKRQARSIKIMSE